MESGKNAKSKSKEKKKKKGKQIDGVENNPINSKPTDESEEEGNVPISSSDKNNEKKSANKAKKGKKKDGGKKVSATTPLEPLSDQLTRNEADPPVEFLEVEGYEIFDADFDPYNSGEIIAQSIIESALSICLERFYHTNAPQLISHELRNTWLRLVEAEWLDEYQPKLDFSDDTVIFQPDVLPMPLPFDNWSRGTLETLPLKPNSRALFTPHVGRSLIGAGGDMGRRSIDKPELSAFSIRSETKFGRHLHDLMSEDSFEAAGEADTSDYPSLLTLFKRGADSGFSTTRLVPEDGFILPTIYERLPLPLHSNSQIEMMSEEEDDTEGEFEDYRVPKKSYRRKATILDASYSKNFEMMQFPIKSIPKLVSNSKKDILSEDEANANASIYGGEPRKVKSNISVFDEIVANERKSLKKKFRASAGAEIDAAFGAPKRDSS